MKRLFIAVKIDESEKIISLLTDLRSKLEGERISWVNSKDMHITLAFLGNTRNDKVSLIEQVMTEAAAPVKPFEIELNGVSLFSKRGDPRVIYFRTAGSPELEGMRSRMAEQLQNSDLYSDSKVYKPHVSAGRIKKVTDRDLIRKSVAAFSDTFILKQKVNSVFLYESILTQSGPVYKVLKEVLLSR
jgi:2'-5' RNA ligase